MRLSSSRRETHVEVDSHQPHSVSVRQWRQLEYWEQVPFEYGSRYSNVKT